MKCRVKEREGERHREISHPLAHSLNDCNGWSWANWELGVPSRSLTGVQGPSSATFPAHKQEGGWEVEAAKTRAGAHKESQCCRQKINLLYHRPTALHFDQILNWPSMDFYQLHVNSVSHPYFLST